MRIKRNHSVIPAEAFVSVLIGIVFAAVGIKVYITNNDLSAFAMFLGLYFFIFVTIILPFRIGFGFHTDIIEMNEDEISLYYKDTLVQRLKWSDITHVLFGYHHPGGKTIILLDREENAIWFYSSKELVSYMLCAYPSIQEKFSTEKQSPWVYLSAKVEFAQQKHKKLNNN